MVITSKKKLFYSLFINDLISDFGDTLYYLALMNYVLLLPDSNLALSIITISEVIPILFKIIMGHIADKTGKKIESIIITQIFRCLLYIFVGIIVSFKPALWIVFTISLINLLSDLAGQIENSLYIPIELQLIEEEDREQVFASTQSVSSVLNIIFKLSGTALVTWISYQTLALINSFTFLICAISMLILKTQLQKIMITTEDEIREPQEDKLLYSIKKAIKEIKQIPNLKEFLITISCINGLFSIITPLIVSIISQDSNFIILNSVTTISLAGIIIAISNILGNIASTTILKKLTLKSAIYVSTIMFPFLFLTLIYKNIWSCYLLLFLLGLLSSSITPKFYGFLMNRLPSEKIGTLMGGIGTLIQLGVILSQISFSVLIIYTSTTKISWLYLLLACTLIFFLTRQLLNTQGEL
ncbi:MFS transporter [Streptococcus hyovaginalis]